MKKFFTNLKVAMTLLLLCGVCNVWGADSITFNDGAGWSSNAGSQTYSDPNSGITIATSNGVYNGNYRAYKNATFTVSSSNGNITKIEVTCTAKGTAQYGPGCFALSSEGGTYEYGDNTGTWEGSSNSVVLTAESNQVRMTSITVTYTGGEDQPKLQSIYIAGTATNLSYSVGDEFNPAGLKVMGKYDKGNDKEITTGITWSFNPETLDENTKSVKVIANAQDKTSEPYSVNVTVTAALPKITITADKIAEFASSYKDYTWTDNNVSGKLFAYKSSNLMQFNSTPYVYNTVAVPGFIKSIKIVKGGGTDRTWSVYCSKTALTSPTGGTQIGSSQTVGTSGYTWEVDTEEKYSYFYITKGSNATQISEIVITYEVDNTPVISADIDEFEFDLKELSGTTTDSKTINATGKNLTAAISATMKSGSDAIFSVAPVGTPNTTVGEFTVSYSTTEAGEYSGTVVLSSGETTLEIPVSVSIVAHIPVLQSISISGEPTKKEYIVGDAFEPAGLVITGTYDVGDPQIITDGIEWIVDPEIFETVGTVSVDVLASVGSFMSDVYTVENITIKEAPKVITEWNKLFDKEYTGSISGFKANEVDWNGTTVFDVSVNVKNGTSTNAYLKDDEIRMYNGYTMTLTAPDGKVFTKIETKKGGKTFNSSDINANVGNVSVKNSAITWVGTTDELILTASNTVTITEMTFTLYDDDATQDVEISDAGWATACVPFNATVTGAEAYYVTVEGDKLTKTKANVILAGAGVLLKGVEGKATTATFTLSTGAADTKANMMKGSLEGEKFEEGGYTYYILANDTKDGIGFYYQGVDGDGTSAECAAGKAVLAVPTGSSAKSFFSLFDDATGIKEINNAEKQDAQYNLNGVRVNGNYKGIVIINGKKVVK